MKKIIVILLTSIIIFSFSSCQNVPEPQIKEGEFPFEMVYEIDGETIRSEEHTSELQSP